MAARGTAGGDGGRRAGVARARKRGWAGSVAGRRRPRPGDGGGRPGPSLLDPGRIALVLVGRRGRHQHDAVSRGLPGPRAGTVLRRPGPGHRPRRRRRGGPGPRPGHHGGGPGRSRRQRGPHPHPAGGGHSRDSSAAACECEAGGAPSLRLRPTAGRTCPRSRKGRTGRRACRCGWSGSVHASPPPSGRSLRISVATRNRPEPNAADLLRPFARPGRPGTLDAAGRFVAKAGPGEPERRQRQRADQRRQGRPAAPAPGLAPGLDRPVRRPSRGPSRPRTG